MPSGKRPANVGEVAAALKYRYADFSHYNLKDPLDELLFIICSTKTSEVSYRATFKALKAAFPTPNQLAQATAEYIAVNQRAIFASDQHEFLPVVLMLG